MAICLAVSSVDGADFVPLFPILFVAAFFNIFVEMM